MSDEQIAVIEKVTKGQPKSRIGIWLGNGDSSEKACLLQIWDILKKSGYQPFGASGSFFGPRHEGVSIGVLSPKARVLGSILQKCLLDSGTSVRLIDDVRIVESFPPSDAFLDIEPGI